MPSATFQMLPSRLKGVEAVTAESCHSFPRHSHESYGIGVIHRGAQHSASGRGRVTARAGDTITVNPGEVHDGVPADETGRAWRMLYIDATLMADIANDVGEEHIRDMELTWPVWRNAGLAEQFSSLFDVVTNGAGDGLRGEELLLQLIADIPHERTGETYCCSALASISRTKTMIDDAPDRPVMLAELARASDLSRFQLLRTFVKATGLTPHAYLMQRRTDLARRLIAGGTRLAEAAATSGFADQSHMTRTFKSKYGLSPAAYAAALR